MRVLHLLIGLVLFGLLAFGGIGTLYVAGDATARVQLLTCAGEMPPWQIAGLGALGLTVVFLYLLTGLPRRRPSYITYVNENGPVSVSIDAIRRHLDGIGNEFAAVVSMKTFLSAVRGTLGIKLSLGVKQGTQIPELCKLVQARVREALEEHLGQCELRGIAVEVTEIKSDRKRIED